MPSKARKRKPQNNPQPVETVKIKGSIARVRFHNPSNGYTVAIFNCESTDLFADLESLITAVGTMTAVRKGDEFELTGSWFDDPKWGRQFKFESYDLVLPTTKKGIVAYLSATAYGIGTVKAGKIYDALGENCLEVIQNQGAAALMRVPGLTPEQAQAVYSKLSANTTLAELTAMICREGVTANLAAKIYNQYGTESIQIVKENPYVLADDLYGVGFKLADRVAQSTGVQPDSPYRVEASIDYILKEAGNDGHCYLRPRDIVSNVMKLLGNMSGVGVDKIAEANTKLINRNKCIREGSCIYPFGMYEAEVNLAERMKTLVNLPDQEVPGIDERIADLETEAGMTYAPEQKEAIRTALTKRLSIITGGPGTGKSTITNAIVTIYSEKFPDKPIHLAAPTGRAAKRISETTGREALTIHRLLRYNPSKGGFEHDEGIPLESGLLIVDEYSMADLELSDDTFKAVPNDMQVVIVGDVDQLPSVGPGSVLRDSIMSGVVPTVRLKFNYRQAAGSNIALFAHMINQGQVPPISDTFSDFESRFCDGGAQVAELVLQEVKNALDSGFEIMDFQVLSPMRRGDAGVNNLNERIRELVNPVGEGTQELRYGNATFRVRDKVMVMKNDYKKGVFNGDIGVIKMIGFDCDNRGNEVKGAWIDFEGSEVFFAEGEDLGILSLAYASTVHKSQGSEFPLVIMTCVKQHYIMLQRNLLYTGITRAKKKLVLVCQPEAVEMAVKNDKTADRFSRLKERLQGL